MNRKTMFLCPIAFAIAVAGVIVTVAFAEEINSLLPAHQVNPDDPQSPSKFPGAVPLFFFFAIAALLAAGIFVSELFDPPDKGVAGYLRLAQSLAEDGYFEGAENYLNAGLVEYPSDPRLQQALKLIREGKPLPDDLIHRWRFRMIR